MSVEVALTTAYACITVHAISQRAHCLRVSRCHDQSATTTDLQATDLTVQPKSVTYAHALAEIHTSNIYVYMILVDLAPAAMTG